MQPIDKNFTPVEYDPQYILMVNQLKKYFPIKGGMVGKTVGQVKAVDGVTFNLKRGTTMGLVGESGCGKTTTGRTILRLSGEKTGGQVLFNGKEVYDLSSKEMREMRTKMQIIFQPGLLFADFDLDLINLGLDFLALACRHRIPPIMVNARRRKNETASSLYLSLRIRWDRHSGASAHRLHKSHSGSRPG